ncbi:MAG: iron-containing alcohol dehydrogenase [Tepidisphaeraceae bacterium]
MTPAVFAFPTTIVFGAGSVAEIGGRLAALGASRPLIVTDPGFRATGAFEVARSACPRDAELFAGVNPNPSEHDVQAAAAAFRERGCDAVIGLGGGSAIDVAKIIRLRARFPEWDLRDPLPAKIVGELAPLVAIPTTAGTGSEVGRSSVITIDRQKRVIFHPSLLARLVILDPQLTVDLPATITAATGADALTHCIESFTSPAFHPLCDGIALEGIRLIADALPRAVSEPMNLDARGKMLIAATMGGIAFQKDLGAAHSLAHPLSAICGLHHGLANALVLPAVMKFNAQRKPWLYERVGKAMGLTNADDDATVQAVESLLRGVGITGGLRGQDVTDVQLDALADAAFADGCHQTNPVPVTRDDLRRLYEEAM